MFEFAIIWENGKPKRGWWASNCRNFEKEKEMDLSHLPPIEGTRSVKTNRTIIFCWEMTRHQTSAAAQESANEQTLENISPLAQCLKVWIARLAIMWWSCLRLLFPLGNVFWRIAFFPSCRKIVWLKPHLPTHLFSASIVGQPREWCPSLTKVYVLHGLVA